MAFPLYSSTYKMHHLQPIPLTQHRPRPKCPRNDLPIPFHRYSVTLHPKLTQQLFQAGRTLQPLKLPRLSVQNQPKRHIASLAGTQ